MQQPDATKRFHFEHWHPNDLAQAELLWGDPKVTVLISKMAFLRK